MEDQGKVAPGPGEQAESGRKRQKKTLDNVNHAVIIGVTIEQPYQEWWRDRPDEARQPVHVRVRKVLIPAVNIER